MSNSRPLPKWRLAAIQLDTLPQLLLLFASLAMIAAGLAVTSLTQMQSLNRNITELTGQRLPSPGTRLSTPAVNFNPENLEQTAVAAKMAYDRAITLALCGALVSLFMGLGLGIGWLSVRAVKRQLVTATKAAEAMTRGDFTSSLESTTKGEVGRLLQSLKGMQERLRQLVASQVEMAKQDRGGSDDQRILKDHFPGAYGEMVSNINHAIANQIALQSGIIETVTRYAKGDFSADLGSLPGKTSLITEAVGGIKANLQSISNEVLYLVEAAAHGDFGGRGDARKYEYGYGRWCYPSDRTSGAEAR
jgi:methyl-accepting chemotaxis protein